MRTAFTTLLAAGTMAAVAAADQPKPGASEVVASKLWAAVAVNNPVYDPNVMYPERLVMHFALVNDGNQAVEPDVAESQLIVNGKPLAARDWMPPEPPAPAPIIGGGHLGSEPPTHYKLVKPAYPNMHGDDWKTVPPGGVAQASFAVNDLFAKPGTYRVSWKGQGFQSPEVLFRVLPRKDQPARSSAVTDTTATASALHEQPAKLAPGTLWAALGLSRLVVEPGESVWMNFTVMNDGKQTVDPGFFASSLIVNGRPIDRGQWSMRLNNGVGTSYDLQLPPGQSTGVGYSMREFITAPGTYRVSWKSTDFESPEVVFRILPRKLK